MNSTIHSFINDSSDDSIDSKMLDCIPNPCIVSPMFVDFVNREHGLGTSFSRVCHLIVVGENLKI
jgi:hypothetical protein